MLADDGNPLHRIYLIGTDLLGTLMRTIRTFSLAALILLLLPFSLIAAVADCLWFRLRTALRGPQPPKGVWQF